jgi:D-glycero-D-manno-heptose 1,7-bisphosphate phosphatase
MRRFALILDRDGTLIEHVPYLSSPDEVRLLPGVGAALRAAQSAGALLFLHSNQSGVGRGMFDAAAVAACNQRLIELLGLGPAPFARICVAMEAPGQPSIYRKPSPAFAREVMCDYGLQASQVWCCGDRGSDLEAARQAGVRGVGVATGLEDLRMELDALGLGESFPVFASLENAITHILRETT